MLFYKISSVVILVSFSLSGAAMAAKKTRHATGLIVPADKDLGVPFLSRVNTGTTLPVNYDLRDEGLATPVKNQGSCGSCWAFAGVASMETAVLKTTDVSDLDFSEQHIVSCDTAQYGCSGGWQPFGFMVKQGVGTEASFPYVARDVSCKRVPVAAKALRWGNIGGANRRATVDEVRQGVVDFGALWITVGANSNWMNVSGATISRCANSKTNHAVSVAGYQTEEKQGRAVTNFLIKNSWGTNWADEGYVKTPLGCNNLGETVSFVVAEGHMCTPPNFGMGKKVGLGRGELEYRVAALEQAGLAYSWTQVGTRNAGSGPIIVPMNQTNDFVVSTANSCGTWTQMVRISAN